MTRLSLVYNHGIVKLQDYISLPQFLKWKDAQEKEIEEISK